VVNDAVNGGSGGHRVLENLIPLGEDEIGSNDHAAAFIAFGKQGEKDFHLVTRLLNIANIIQDQDFKTVQTTEFKLQFEITPVAKQAIHQAVGWGKENTTTHVDQFVTKGGSKVSFPSSRQTKDEYILASINKLSGAELGKQSLYLERRPRLARHWRL